MRLLIAATIAAACASGTALADQHYETDDPYPKCFDKALLAFVECPAEYSFYDWSGWYVGVHAGYADMDLTGGYDLDSNGAVLAQNLDVAGFAGGGQLGYNLDFGNLVFGLEVDASLADIEDSVQTITGGDNNKVTAKVNGFGSVRARVGMPIDEFLPYLTAGAGLVDYEITVDDIGDGVKTSEDKTALAGVIGGGLEIGLFEDVTVRGEGLYYIIEEDHMFAEPAQTPDPISVEDLWTLRGAVNMRF